MGLFAVDGRLEQAPAVYLEDNESYATGLAGQAEDNTSYGYAVGSIWGSGLVGGLIGDNTVTDSYRDTVTSAQSHRDGGTGKNANELQPSTSSPESTPTGTWTATPTPMALGTSASLASIPRKVRRTRSDTIVVVGHANLAQSKVIMARLVPDLVRETSIT